MKLKELMNAKVSDVVSKQLASEIEILEQMQTRIGVYTDSKRNDDSCLYIALGDEVSNLLSDAMTNLIQLMSEEFKQSIDL